MVAASCGEQIVQEVGEAKVGPVKSWYGVLRLGDRGVQKVAWMSVFEKINAERLMEQSKIMLGRNMDVTRKQERCVYLCMLLMLQEHVCFMQIMYGNQFAGSQCCARMVQFISIERDHANAEH